MPNPFTAEGRFDGTTPMVDTRARPGDPLRRPNLTLLLTALAFGSGCVPKHPVVALERQAKRYERHFAKESPETTADDSYFVRPDDARAAAAAFLSTQAEPREIQEHRVGTDWQYGGSVGVDETSEFYDQERARGVASLTPVGPELQASAVIQRGRRRLRPDSRPSPWSESSEDVDISPLQDHLQRLEDGHLVGVRASGSTKTLLADFERTLPDGFVVAEQGADFVRVERIETASKEKPKQEWWATWDARISLTATVEPETHNLHVDSRLDHRFITESEEGGWTLAETQNGARAVDWLAATLRTAIPAKRAAFGEALAEAVPLGHVALSEPPPPPRLRTMDEIEVVVRARAFEHLKGDFTVCVNHVVVSSKTGNGYDWDLPGLSDALGGTEAVASVAEGALGEINAIGDSQPLIGALADKGMARISSGTIDRTQAESIARVTADVAGWAKSARTFRPDVFGAIAIGADQFVLPETADSLTVKPDVCGDVRFQRGQAIVALDLWDKDLQEHDSIGRCQLSPDDVVNRGLTGVSCGFARVYASARFNFSFGQIAIVGLPAAE